MEDLRIPVQKDITSVRHGGLTRTIFAGEIIRPYLSYCQTVWRVEGKRDPHFLMTDDEIEAYLVPERLKNVPSISLDDLAIKETVPC
jgi:hypothetical protein